MEIYYTISKRKILHIVTDNKQAFNWIAGVDKLNETFIIQLITIIYKISTKIYKNMILLPSYNGVMDINGEAIILPIN